MQNITVKDNGNNVSTYSVYDYTVEYSVTIMCFNNNYMVYGAVHHEDYSVYVENDSMFKNVSDALETLKSCAFARLNDYNANKMCALLSTVIRMFDEC